MAAGPAKFKLNQGPLDVWSTREKLALACSVMKSGDQNWVSVSRAIKPYVESNRPANWFSQKNCALQYSDLLEKVETPKRKRGDGGEIDTPGDQIFRKLMTERIEELRRIALEEQQRYKKLKKDVETIKSGQYDDRLSEIWDQMQAEKKAAEEAREAEKKAMEEARAQAQVQVKRTLITKRPSVTSQSSLSEQDDTQECYPDFLSLELPKAGDEDPASLPLTTTPPVLGVASQSEQRTKAVTPTSPLLSSLLQSKLKSADGLQQLKNAAEQAEQAEALTQQQQVKQLAQQLKESAENAVSQAKEQAAAAAAAAQQLKHTPVLSHFPHTESLPTSPSCAAPTLSKLLFTPAQQKVSTDSVLSVLPAVTPTPVITVTEVTSPVEVVETTDTKTENVEQDSADSESITVDVTAVEVSSVEDGEREDLGGDIEDLKEDAEDEGTADELTQSDCTPQERGDSEQLRDEKEEVDEEDPIEAPNSFRSVDDEVSLKEDPASPASSVSSKVSESGGKTYRHRRKRGRGRGRRGRPCRRSVQDDDRRDDNSSKHSDGDMSDDDLRESDDPNRTSLSMFSESIPNSPASLSMCSDTEDEKAFKTWKKSIMLVWRSAANHKYANVFLHPVKNEIAPGYKSIVHRPMDLGTIKKNIESGSLRTTSEFQRDMMLMFTNAVMYNSSDHDVFKMATEMYNDVMQHIEQYVSTQLMVQSNETKMLRQSRRTELQEKEEEGKKRRTSQEQPSESGKTKKRKTRADDT